MTETGTHTSAELTLPPNVVTKIDVSRLVREMERVDNEMTAETVRAKAGATKTSQLVMSDQLTAFLELNEYNLQESTVRSELIKQLRALKDQVPVLHMTFAVTADPESLQQIAGWVRQSVHPQAVIEVGLQPGLVAGVYLRTPNHVHDLSMRSKLAQHRNLLVEELETLRGSQ